MFDWLKYAPQGIVPVIIGGIALAVAVRVLAGFLDVWRIGGYIAAAGGQMLSCRCWPFGPGWLGEKRDRIYHVAFIDLAGVEHRAYCKTSLLTGVYFTQDRVVGGVMPTSSADAAHEPLRDEVRRLREENRLLRQQLAAKLGDPADR